MDGCTVHGGVQAVVAGIRLYVDMTACMETAGAAEGVAVSDLDSNFEVGSVMSSCHAGSARGMVGCGIERHAQACRVLTVHIAAVGQHAGQDIALPGGEKRRADRRWTRMLHFACLAGVAQLACPSRPYLTNDVLGQSWTVEKQESYRHVRVAGASVDCVVEIQFTACSCTKFGYHPLIRSHVLPQRQRRRRQCSDR